ncbi:MAG TPA: ATP-binding protein [Chitinophagaceae bacterium]|nr:ATP-binding protein [Chitinophagaceae bacterium]
MPETIRYYIIGFVIAFLLLGLFIILLAALYSNRQTKNKNEKLKMQSQFAQTLLQSQLEIQEQTLQHISHELHDNLGQVASLIKINLNTLQLDDPIKASQKIETTKDITRQLITDLKLLSVRLGSDRITKTGLAKALETEIDRLNKTGQFTATLSCQDNLPPLNNDKATILYRMSQEILNNIVKHSSAKQIMVLLNASENLFTLAFNDDGVGFDIAEKMQSGGAGLFNLQNRARLINAQLTIQSTPNNGTTVTIGLPL